jgi:hypothetical protein
MELDPIFQEAYSKLYGKPCWNVKPGHGSFLTFEFGEPRIEIIEPRTTEGRVSARVRRNLARRIVYPRGEWHLWIYCCDWSVSRSGKVVGDCSTNRRIRKAADDLDGQVLTDITIVKRGCRTIFEFDLGSVMETKPYDRGSEQWMLYEPSGNVLTLRADKRYSYQAGDTATDKTEWLPIDVARA